MKKVTEACIREWVGATASQRGQGYVAQGKVLQPRRSGMLLKALCQGQAVEPYRVWVRLGEGEEPIVAARCTCPVGGEGRCKHVAAVLHLWRASPEAFAPEPPLAAQLMTWSQADLVALICRMVERDPDLRALVALHDAAPKPPRNQ